MSDETGTTVTIAPTAEERVAAGIAWAQSVGLNPDAINVEQLDLRSNHNCTLAQMVRAAHPDAPWNDAGYSAPYGWGAHHYGLFADDDVNRTVAYGFEWDLLPEVTADQLQAAWVAALMERTKD